MPHPTIDDVPEIYDSSCWLNVGNDEKVKDFVSSEQSPSVTPNVTQDKKQLTWADVARGLAKDKDFSDSGSNK